MKIRPLIVYLAALSLALTACVGGTSEEQDAGKVNGDPTTVNSGTAQAGTGDVKVAVAAAPTNWNVATPTGNSVVTEYLASLIMPAAFISQPDWTLKINEDLLVSADVTANDPQTVEYVINPDAKWSDGTPINAKDFVYTWQVQNGKDCADCQINAIGGYGSIASVEGADDGKRVIVKFSETYGEWQSLFKFIFPSHIAAKHGTLKESFDTFFAQTVPEWSGGPLKLSDYIKDESINLVPNEAWYGDKPNLKTVNIRIITDQAQWPTALANGEISMMATEPTTDLVAELDNMTPQGFKYQLSPGNRLVWLGVNMKDPKWQNKALREAVMTAIDMESVIDRTVGQFADFVKPSRSLVYLPNQPGYTDSMKAAGVDYGSGNVEAATKMLTDAGYEIKDKKLYAPDGNPVPDIKIVTYRRLAFENIARATVDDLRAIGVNAQMVADPSPFGNYVIPGNYDFSLLNWSMVPFSASKASTSWTSKANSTGFKSAEVDDSIFKAMRTVDPAEATSALQAGDRLLLESSTAMPFFQLPSVFGYQGDLVNVRDNPSLNSGPTYNVVDWGIKAE
ncbi:MULTISPECIES: ABC transporter family substrate-binding protein [unclassified Pseudarthrobacter]|uniref:ABC transporter family substrate-binding protein n=1 Tax=unclassified Pseudarthrobacter TaxID=2647000 RepID=UPI0030789012